MSEMTVGTENVIKKIKNKKKNRSIVSFEEELINKERATEVLSKLPKAELVFVNEEQNEQKTDKKQKKSKNKKRGREIENDMVNKDNLEDVFEKKLKTSDTEENLKDKKNKKKHEVNSKVTHEVQNNKGKKPVTKQMEGDENPSKTKSNKKKKVKTTETLEVEQREGTKGKITKVVVGNDENPEKSSNSEESKRAKNRKKHLELMAAKKLKATLVSQENVLNYLSKWKHSRIDWKFEKLKQIWLSQKLFDSTKIPDEFWDTTVEYFLDSKGFIRNLILREALKIVETEDTTKEENTDEGYQSKLKRARDIVQSLQE